MSTLHVVLSFIASAALLGLLLIVCEIGLTVWRALTGPEVDPATLPARDRHPSRALPRRWE